MDSSRQSGVGSFLNFVSELLQISFTDRSESDIGAPKQQLPPGYRLRPGPSHLPIYFRIRQESIPNLLKVHNSSRERSSNDHSFSCLSLLPVHTQTLFQAKGGRHRDCLHPRDSERARNLLPQSEITEISLT